MYVFTSFLRGCRITKVSSNTRLTVDCLPDKQIRHVIVRHLCPEFLHLLPLEVATSMVPVCSEVVGIALETGILIFIQSDKHSGIVLAINSHFLLIVHRAPRRQSMIQKKLSQSSVQ